MKTIKATPHLLALAVILSSSLAARPDTIYVGVGYPGRNSIERFSQDGTDLGPFASVSGWVEGLAFDMSGNLYAVISGDYSDSVVRFTPNGTPSLFANRGLNNPYGLTVDSQGNVYVANFGNDTIEKFAPDGTPSVFANTGLDQPTGLTVDRQGNIYAANFGNSTIEKFTPGGTPSLFASSGLSMPFGLAFKSNGNLFVANFGNGSIEEITPDGNPAVDATGLPYPRGLAFDSSDDVYMASAYPANVWKFDPSGHVWRFDTAVAGYPEFVATIIPEPSVSVLLLAGIAALLARNRLQNRQGAPPLFSLD